MRIHRDRPPLATLSTFEDSVAPSPPVIGDRYRLGPTLGSGSSGAVFEAEDLRTGERVALKLFRRDSDPRRLRREVAALQLLDIPGVVVIRSHGEHVGQPFVVMDLLTGRPWPGTDSPRWSDLAVATHTLLVTVAKLHRLRVVHRDLKPSNVLVDSNQRSTLLDFGLAKGNALGQSFTGTHQILGTPLYMAPEQLDARACGPHTDIYSVGMMLYGALTGSLPHRDLPLLQLLEARKRGDIPPCVPSSPDTPAAVCRVVDAMLHADLSTRPPSADHVLETLSSLEPETAPAIRILPTQPDTAAGRPSSWDAFPVGLDSDRSLYSEARDHVLADADDAAIEPTLAAATQAFQRGEPELAVRGLLAMWSLHSDDRLASLAVELALDSQRPSILADVEDALATTPHGELLCAERLLREGDPKSAAMILETLPASPHKPLVAFEIALQTGTAAAFLRTVDHVAPDRVWVWRARVAKGDGREEDAARAFEHAGETTTGARSILARTHAATAWLTAQHPERAAEAAESAIRSASNVGNLGLWARAQLVRRRAHLRMPGAAPDPALLEFGLQSEDATASLLLLVEGWIALRCADTETAQAAARGALRAPWATVRRMAESVLAAALNAPLTLDTWELPGAVAADILAVQARYGHLHDHRDHAAELVRRPPRPVPGLFCFRPAEALEILRAAHQ